MNCQRFDDAIDLLAAGELEPGAAAEAESHARQCPECARGLEAARERLRTLATSLGTLSLSGEFVERVMTCVRAEALRAEKPAEAPSRERWRVRALRYAAYAAAASLFLMAGYGLIQRPSAAFQFRSGQASLVGPKAAALLPGARIAPGQVVATPVNSRELGRLDMAGGHLQAVLGRGSLMRFADPRTGVLATLDKGDLFWRATGARASASFATPLARVQAGAGDFSIHVAPTPGEGEQGHFTGQVTIVTHNGGASVQLPGPEQRPLALGPGQVLTLRSDPHRPAVQPLPFDAVEKSIQGQLRELQVNRGNFERLYQEVSDAVRTAPFEQQGELFRKAVGYQEAIRQAEQAASDRTRLLDMVRRAHDEGQHIFHVVLQQTP